MSVRGSFATPVIAVFYALIASSAVFGATSSRPAGTSASRPSVGVVKSPATAPAETGVVRVALRRLATIPRAGTELPQSAGGQPAGSAAPSAATGTPGRPVPDGKSVEKVKPLVAAGQDPTPQAPAYQPQAESQQPVPMQPVPNPAYVYPVPSPYVYVPPPYMQMPPGEMSPADREWNSYLSFGGMPWRYGYGPYSDRYPVESWGDAYRFGFTSSYNYWRFHHYATERQESVTSHALDAMDKGLGLFRAGNYAQALSAFKLAAETNQGDPAARIYAVHALFATGRYREAMPFLKRAFELQPKIALLDYDMRDDYGRRADFDNHVRALEAALAQSPGSIERLVVLGYVRYYSGRRDAAYEPLAKAKAIDPTNTVVDRLLPHCTPPDVVLDRQKAAGKPAAAR